VLIITRLDFHGEHVLNYFGQVVTSEPDKTGTAKLWIVRLTVHSQARFLCSDIISTRAVPAFAFCVEFQVVQMTEPLICCHLDDLFEGLSVRVHSIVCKYERTFNLWSMLCFEKKCEPCFWRHFNTLNVPCPFSWQKAKCPSSTKLLKSV
jgi:hypothetical protein